MSAQNPADPSAMEMPPAPVRIHQPSDAAEPTQVNEAPQQASTMPNDGAQATVDSNKVPWKEQVIGYAQKTRGTVLGKSGVKEHGDQVLRGETSAREPPPDKSKSTN